MCVSELYGFGDKIYSRWLCFFGLMHSVVLGIHTLYAYNSGASSDHWHLYVDHFKPQEVQYYFTITLCTAIACVATLANTYEDVVTSMVMWVTGGIVFLVTCLAVLSYVTCISAGPSHVVKSFMLFSFMWPFVAMFCIFLNLLYLDEVLSNDVIDWQYLTDKFTVNLPLPHIN
uniref:Uncharacterized protein n=1 Tax=Cacopsylla melanoneura TaxID=428564 RepID=A0A8D8ZGD1_9HEMI